MSIACGGTGFSANGMDRNYQLKLFICGHTEVSDQAVMNLTRFIKARSDAHFELTIIDVLDRPELAESYGIIATPSLYKEHPLPRQVFVGDLSEMKQIKIALGLWNDGEEAQRP